MKKIHSIISLTILVFAFTGFLLIAAEKEKVTITFMRDARSELDKMEELLPGFESETGIEVESLILQETALRAKTGLEVSAESTDIDVIMTDFTYLKKYADAKYLKPLDSYLEKSDTFRKEDFTKPFIDAVSFYGKMYGVPLYQDCNLLVYRADLFAKYNLDVPQTFDDLEYCARVIHEEEPGVVGIVLRGARGVGGAEWPWTSFLWGYGGSYFTEDMRSNIMDPNSLASIEMYIGLLQKYGPEGAANYSYIEVQNDMLQGKAGMFIDSATLGIRCEDPSASKVAGKLGYAVVPGNEKIESAFYTWACAIPEKCDNPEEAGVFIAWLTSPEIAGTVGWSAPNQALEKVYAIQPYAGYDQSEPLIKVMKEALTHAGPDSRPRIPEGNEIITITSNAISDVLAGGITIRDAFADVEKAINKILIDAGY